MKSPKLIKRYRELKQLAPESVLLMQVGGFMPVMDDDVRTVAGVTGLKLQMAGDVDDPVVVGGFPNQSTDHQRAHGQRARIHLFGEEADQKRGQVACFTICFIISLIRAANTWSSCFPFLT